MATISFTPPTTGSEISSIAVKGEIGTLLTRSTMCRAAARRRVGRQLFIRRSITQSPERHDSRANFREPSCRDRLKSPRLADDVVLRTIKTRLWGPFSLRKLVKFTIQALLEPLFRQSLQGVRE